MSEDLSHEDVFAGFEAARHTLLSAHVCELRAPKNGERVELGQEFRALILLHGRSGVVRGWDHRGMGLQEVREFDFAAWPATMPERDCKALRRIVHSPEWVLISAGGYKAAQPVTGRWLFRGDDDFERLSKLPLVGEVSRTQ